MKLNQLLQKNKKQFIKYIIGALMTTINGLSFTIALSNAFGIIQEPTSDGVINRILVSVVLVFVPIITQIISRYLRIGFMRDVLIQVRTLAYNKIMSLSYSQFKQQPKDFYMANLVSDINLFEKDFFLSLLNITYCFGSFILGSILLIYISPIVALTTLLITILLYVITVRFEPIIEKAKLDTQEANANTNIEISNILNGMEVIKLYHVEQHFKLPFKNIILNLEHIKNVAFKKESFHGSINHFISFVYQMAVFIYATYLYTQNALSITSLIIVFNLMGQMVWSMISGFNFINRYKSSIQIYERITSIEETNIAEDEMVFNNSINVTGLSFSYTEDTPVLNNVEFSIKPSSKVLITGPSGTGKTTLLNCLTQNLTNYTGNIRIDGKELDSINHSSFLKHTGYIRQEHFLFNDSIKNNIVLNSKYDKGKLDAILESVDLLEWINQLEDKEEHLLKEDGSNISGGQRQRISIARELYHNKDILFVDEPSASLDDYTSQKIYDTLLALDKTIICVSHRHLEYLTQHFDQVINLGEKGELI